MSIRSWINSRSRNELKETVTRLLCRAGTSNSSRRHALFVCYYRHVRHQSLYPKIGLVAVAMCSVGCWMFLDNVEPLKNAAVAVAVLLLLKAREAVLGIRVARRYFGTTESEVREFIKFIEAYRRGNDFTDPPGGKRLPVLAPKLSTNSTTTALPQQS